MNICSASEIAEDSLSGLEAFVFEFVGEKDKNNIKVKSRYRSGCKAVKSFTANLKKSLQTKHSFTMLVVKYGDNESDAAAAK